MKIFVHEYVRAKIALVVVRCVAELKELGCEIVWTLGDADVAVAPLLQRKISDEELAKLKLGTLIFHPSLLPRHRGRDAIRWAYHLEEKFTGATWFWADSGLDTGDICEQEVVAIDGKRPRDFYEQDIIPVAVRLLRYVILDLQAGIMRRRPQNQSAATCEPAFPRR
ncbi:MAG TPA: formyl transferase [Planctomycetaceae bacterium]|nr:formyl transferase [Planctomycetaceae bacterium]